MKSRPSQTGVEIVGCSSLWTAESGGGSPMRARRGRDETGIRITLRPEAARAVLSLAGGAGASELPERMQGAEDLVALLLHHPTTEIVMEAERIQPGDLRDALLRLARGGPSGLPGLSLRHPWQDEYLSAGRCVPPRQAGRECPASPGMPPCLP